MTTKLTAMMAVACMAVSVAAMAMSRENPREEVDDAKVQAAIDGRLHDLLVQMRMQRDAR